MMKLFQICYLAALISIAPARTQADVTALPTWAIGPFERPLGDTPLLRPVENSRFFCPIRRADVEWEAVSTFNPAAAIFDRKVILLYRAEDSTGQMVIGMHTSRLGLCTSRDGLNFSRNAQPVFYPDNDNQEKFEWSGGCEDPRLIAAPDGTYVMTYTQWNRKHTRLAIATTSDFVHWKKHGAAFAQAYGGKYLDLNCKSGAIVGSLQNGQSNGQIVATPIKGDYWMYWGAGLVHLARSKDLIHWTPVLTPQGELLAVLRPRAGKFDSRLVEAGPPAVLTANGIVAIYNGMNAKKDGDRTLPADTYSAGEVLFDINDPSQLIGRLDRPCLKPEMSFERTGQFAAGTTFCEGLVHFSDQWLLYYGCADSRVGVAVARLPAVKAN